MNALFVGLGAGLVYGLAVHPIRVVLLAQGVQSGAIDLGGQTTIIGMPGSDQPWAFLLACMVVALGAFLLWQAGQLQRWRFAGETNAPNWTSAPLYGCLVSAAVGIFGFVWLRFQNGWWDPQEFEAQFIHLSGQFVPIPLLMAVPLLVLAGYSFLVAGFALRRQPDAPQSPGWPILGAITAFAALVASILRLLEAIKTHP